MDIDSALCAFYNSKQKERINKTDKPPLISEQRINTPLNEIELSRFSVVKRHTEDSPTAEDTNTCFLLQPDLASV